jgi:hypothetical protein
MYYKVYFILAHKNPHQIKDLITLLDDGKSLFFMHVDGKISLSAFKCAESSNVIFIKNRIQCYWGDFSLLKATLNGMEAIATYMKLNYDNHDYHFVLLSGEDLPLKSNAYINDFLKARSNTSFLHHWKLPYKNWWGGGFFRFESLFLFNPQKHKRSHFWLNYIIKKIGLDFFFPINTIKKYFPDLELFGSSQWMIFSKEMVKRVIETSKNDPLFIKQFRFSFAPDETYFPTLINHYGLAEDLIIENLNTNLAVFKHDANNASYLSINEIQDNNKPFTLFARKFDTEINADSIEYSKTLRK